MKSPDEIKKGLECCKVFDGCSECPYATSTVFPYGIALYCTSGLATDSLAYIKKLERERDELFRDVSLEISCSSCKHVGTKLRKNPCKECLQDITTKCHWEWRGVKEKEK